MLGNKYVGGNIKKKYRSDYFVKSEDFSLNDWKIVYCKSARALTYVPDTFKKLVKQQVRWKKSFIRNVFFTGKFYWKKSLIPAIVYYAHVLFVFIGPFVAFKHLIYMPIQGNVFSALLYMAGILYVGFMFGLAYKLENRDSHKWIYRPLMSLLSTFCLSWLLFYSILTIRKMLWTRG